MKITVNAVKNNNIKRKKCKTQKSCKRDTTALRYRVDIRPDVA